MTLSMGFFAVGDALVKVATGLISPGQGVLLMALFMSVIFAVLCWRGGVPFLAAALTHPVVLLRNGVEAITAVCFFCSLAVAPLSQLVSIVQAVPLVVTLFAALMLGETVGPRRWAAVGVGMLGVLVMMRPWTQGLTWGILFAAIAACGLATRDLAARFVPAEVPTVQLALWGSVSLIPAGLLLTIATGPMAPLPWSGIGVMLATSTMTASGYYLITAAMRTGDVSLIAPLRYLRLPFALVLAVVFLGERPDTWTLLGAIVVVASGCYVMLRERQLAREGAE